MAPSMKFKSQFCAMYPSRTNSNRDAFLSAHVRTLARGTELFAVYSAGPEGAIVSAWEEDQSHSGGRDEDDLPPMSPPPFRSLNNPTRRNSPGNGLVPTDIGWGEPIFVSAQNVSSVATAYLNGLKSNQKLIWLSPWLLGSPIPFMWPAVFDMPKLLVVAKYKGKAYMIREVRKNWFVPIINGWEFKEWGNKDLYMLMLFLEQVA